ncbi:MAG: MFS transporter [Verrucomicrobia bacterium]|nr:MFS transporter [Verrucomicrobiota bacterium]MDA1086672.1 MFS transporter [Verrucomicrobiota bacterium]
MTPRLYGNKATPWLRNALGTLTLSGCLAMVYIAGTTSPAFTEFMRSIGTTEFEFGLLMGIPLMMFLLQFVGAFVNNRIRRRKALFITTGIAGRLLYIPVVLLPVLLPGADRTTLIYIIIALITVSAAAMQLSTPLFFSWTADLVPGQILNRYWGGRQLWMYLLWSASYGVIILFTFLSDLPITVTYPIIAVVAVFAGVIDILLFIGIPEPPNTVVREVSLAVLFEPFRHVDYRSFVVASGARWAIVTFAAAFMALYMLEELHLAVWQTTIIFCSMGLGAALSSRPAGRLADRHGHRPLLIITACLKPLTPLAILIATPSNGFVLLTTYMFFDGMVNGALLVAANGYMMKISPKRNRSMFCAAMTGFSGICGGIGAIAGGTLLELTSPLTWDALGRTWGNFHLLFIVGTALRLICIPLCRGIREPKSTRTGRVLSEVRGIGPLQFLRFPIGLYRNQNESEESSEADS